MKCSLLTSASLLWAIVRVLIYHLEHGYPCSGDHFFDVIEVRLGRLRNAVADFQSL